MPAAWAGGEESASRPADLSAGAESSPAEIRSRVVEKPGDLAHWWESLQDPELTSLVTRALDANLDIRQAEARIREARAACTIAGADLWPQLNASASASRNHASVSNGNNTVSATANLYRAGFDALWEIDLFGGTRRAMEAAGADLQASVDDRRAVLISVAAEVATIYSDLRASQQQIVIARENLESQLQSVALTRERFRGGFVSGLDVANAETQASTTASRIPTFETTVRQSIYALGVLLDREPASLVAELSATAPQPPLPPEVPIGLPSELLRRRPDIARAESQLHAATARIGVATADLYPKFTLLGSLGLQGATFSDATSLSNKFWSFGGAITWPIFSGGRIDANIELQKALTDESFLNYRKTVLTALQETESALVAYSNEQRRRSGLSDAVRSGREAVDIANQLYAAGRTDFLNVLASQRVLYDSEDSLAQSDRQAVANLVALYKALGGGWEADESGERGAARGE